MFEQKKFENLTIMDDFLFGKVFSDEKMILRLFRTYRIDFPEDVPVTVMKQHSVKLYREGKEIRSDVAVRFGNHVFIITEAQNKGRKEYPLGKRDSFYQSQYKVFELDEGAHYNEIGDTTIVFICNYDPFRKGMVRYTFQARCEQDPEIILENGMKTEVINLKGDTAGMSEEEKALTEYFKDGTVGDDMFVKELDHRVHQAKRNEEYRQEYYFKSLAIQDAEIAGEKNAEKRIVMTFIRSEREAGIPVDQIYRTLTEKMKLSNDLVNRYMQEALS